MFLQDLFDFLSYNSVGIDLVLFLFKHFILWNYLNGPILYFVNLFTPFFEKKICEL